MLGGQLDIILGLILFFLSIAFIAYRYVDKFLEWLRFQSIGTRDYIVDRLNMMFIEITPQRVLLYQFLGSAGMGMLIFLMMLPQWGAGLLFGAIVTIVGWKAPKPVIDWMYIRRVKTFNTQMVDALNLMSNSLKSGLSVVQSLALVVQEMPNPIQQEFNLVLSENKLGVTIEESFANLSKRVQSDDVEMFVTSINILRETGGNLAETFDTISNTIRERIKLEKKIDAMTAMGRNQAMMLLLVPPALGIFLQTSEPEFARPLFTTPAGWAIILVVLLLEATAYFVVSKITKINV